jgi:serine phosphatase RsbU (regulator of sigma subunit)/CBS domain-containing protein
MPFQNDLTVRKLMTANPIRLSPDRPIQEALEIMNQKRIGAIPITNEQNQIVGIFTERDFLRRAVSASPGWRTMPISEWMSPFPYTIHPDAGWEEAVQSMERLRVGHLPVVEDGKLVGILSTRQVMSQRNLFLKQSVEERTRELKRANEELLARDSEFRHYMQMAARLQRRFVIPTSPPDWPELAWGIHFAPLDPLGGDYYDFALPDEDHLGVLMTDASGHSLPAAMVAIMARQAFSEIANKTISPSQALEAVGKRLYGLIEDRFVTAFYAIYNRKTRELTYSNAGHTVPYLFRARTKTCERLYIRGLMLGITPDETYQEKTVVLEPEDRLCLYTDGLTDARNEIGEFYGTERLVNYLSSHPELHAQELADGLFEDMNNFRGSSKLTDDVSIVVAECCKCL